MHRRLRSECWQPDACWQRRYRRLVVSVLLYINYVLPNFILGPPPPLASLRLQLRFGRGKPSPPLPFRDFRDRAIELCQSNSIPQLPWLSWRRNIHGHIKRRSTIQLTCCCWVSWSGTTALFRCKTATDGRTDGRAGRTDCRAATQRDVSGKPILHHGDPASRS